MSTPMDLESLRGLRVLVTGGGKRVGAYLARGLARHGCRVVIHYRSSGAEATALVDEIRAAGGEVALVQGDLARRDDIARVAREAVAAFGGLDVLVNNASTYPEGDAIDAGHSLGSETWESWEDALNVNARAPFFLIQSLLPALLASGKGSVINILDRSVSIPFVDRAAHTVSKAALASVSRLAAKTFEGRIRVNALELGAILPGEGMSTEQESRRAWVGVEPVLEAIVKLLSNPLAHDSTIEIGTKNPAS